MPLLDDRGRLLGKINLVDAAIGAFLIFIGAVGYASYALFRTPPPEITAVEPDHLLEGQKPPLVFKVRGRNLRPYLRASIGASLTTFLIESPETAELTRNDPLPPGMYDVVLFDQSREVTRRRNALTVQARPPIPERSYELTLQLACPPDTQARLKRDLSARDTGEAAVPRLRVISIDQERTAVGKRKVPLVARPVEPEHWIEIEERVVILDVVVRVVAQEAPTGPMFDGTPLRLGRLFSIEHPLYTVQGSIVDVHAVDGDAASPQSK